MALSKEARNKLYTFVQTVKRLLTSDIEGQLQQFYGIRPDGTVLMVEQLSTRDTDRLYRARLLRDRLSYLSSNMATPKDRDGIAHRRNSVQQLVREQAFTILNRFAALRMAEERTIIQETVRQGFNSAGFLVFDSVTGGGASADLFTRYTWYLNAVFDELAVDLPAVFDRFSPYALMFPSEPSLIKLFDLLSAEDMVAFRPVGRPAINLWREDETIGWMYQFYNADDERKQMREAPAPRNSRELAVRNQFFTPRYVVQFLTDNTLGRIWYDMTQGETELAKQCKFLISEKAEDRTAQPPTPKDPRTIRLLDPACGSMHFGLYAFDLFAVIYREVWDGYPHLLGDLRDTITRDEFIRQIPALILAHNIHGVDIDPRALQIAGLSLWLRAQRAYDELGLSPADRPAITKANLVLAEAMPGNPDLLSEAVQGLTKPMRRLVMHLWQQMQLAGEMGVVLRMEHEIRQEIERIERDWNELAKANQGDLFDAALQAEAEQLGNLNNRELRERFFENAEREVLDHLRDLAETATNGDAYQKLLFADDTARGFAFIELCRQRYDVVVMNPPFGATSVATKDYIENAYPDGKRDLAAVFIERMHEMLLEDGLLGAITTRNIFFLGSYLEWRQQYIIHHTYLKYMADLGLEVLDAMVETAAYVMSRKDNKNSIFLRITKPKGDQKEAALLNSLSTGQNQFIQKTSRFRVISNEPLAYWVDEKTLKLFEGSRFEKGLRASRQGTSTSDKNRFTRNAWEPLPQYLYANPAELFSGKKWILYLESETSTRFFDNGNSVVNWRNAGEEVKALLMAKFNKGAQSESTYFNYGITWSYRTAKFSPHIVRKGGLSTNHRFLTLFDNNVQLLYTCSLWNSEYFDYLLKLSMEWITRPQFINGVINRSPYPTLPEDLQIFLARQTMLNHGLIKAVFEREETSLYFARPALAPAQSLKESMDDVMEQFAQNKALHLASLAQINEQVYAHFGITEEEQNHIREIISNEDARPEGAVFNVPERELADGIFSWLLGVAFGRWDVRLSRNPEWLPIKEDLFSLLPSCSVATLVGIGKDTTEGVILLPATANNIVSEEWLQARKTLEDTDVAVTNPVIGAADYPVSVRWDGLAVVENGHPADLMEGIRAALRYLYGTKANDTEKELASMLNVDDLAEYISQPGRFFASHLAQYTQNKRTAPIYWPLSIPSGRYTVWVYYPRINDQTLYRIVTDYVKPKQADLADDIRRLEAASTDRDRKLLADSQSLRAELEQMETDLLRIAEMPYRPNHNDGVLLTAAPLHGFFRNRKWQQATETAWRELQNGDYDWAHLTLTIWPERVRNKCKTDLSMAIAHGLEDTCTVKPKEKKERPQKEVGPKGNKGRKIIDEQLSLEK